MMYENKLHIEIFILIFMFIIVSLCILFSLYYITPNNYALFDFELYLKSDIQSTLIKEYTIEPNKDKVIKYCQYPDKVFRIFNNDKEHISITIENRFKSENIYVSKNQLVKLINGNLIIKNTTNDILKITIELYPSQLKT